MYSVLPKRSWCLLNQPLTKLPLAMKRITCVISGFQTHSDRFGFVTETARGDVGWESVWSGCRLEVCEYAGRERARFLKLLRVRGGFKSYRWGRERTKHFNPSSANPLSYTVLWTSQNRLHLEGCLQWGNVCLSLGFRLIWNEMQYYL